MTKCKICKDKFKPISSRNIVCSKEKCKKENIYLCIKKYMKSEKGKICLRKSKKKNRVKLVAKNLINGIYVKKYSNGKTDFKITLYRKCSKGNCNNTFYSIANENIELGKFDKKYCSRICSNGVREKIAFLNNPEKRIILNKKRAEKRKTRRLTDENYRLKEKERGKKYRQSKKGCLIYKAKTKLRMAERDKRTRLTTPKISSELKKLVAFYKSKKEYKNYNNLHADHIYALKGKNYSGLTNANNLQWLPSELNVKKSNMDFDKWQKICKQNRKQYIFILNKHGLKFNRQYITIPL